MIFLGAQFDELLICRPHNIDPAKLTALMQILIALPIDSNIEIRKPEDKRGSDA
jgi:hypothetical protein